MSGKDYLLDTNIVIGLFANELSVTEKIKSLSSSFSIPSIVIGELFYSADNLHAEKKTRKKLKHWLRHRLFSNATLILRDYMEK